MTGLQTRNEIARSASTWSRVPVSSRRLRLSLALLLSMFFIGFVGPANSASDDWFIPELEATARQDHVEVVVRVSASVGSSLLENHPLGTYEIPNDSKIAATLEAGIATFKLLISTEGDIVFVVVDMIVPNSPPQKKSKIAYLKR